MRSARVFVHPRCFSGPAHGALIASLEERAFDLDTMFIGPEDSRGRRELVRMISRDDDALELERMDGVRFVHRQTAPGAA